MLFFFFKQKTAYEIRLSLVGSEMCIRDRAYVREAYKDGAAALFHLKNMGHMIPKLFEVSDITVQVQGPAKEIEPLKEILPDADFYEAISGF